MNRQAYSGIFYIIVIIFAFIAVAVSYFRIFDIYELQSLDFRFNLRGAIRATSDIALIEIGDDTIKKLGAFPFKRSYHALLVKALSYAGARMIVFDIFFSDPAEGDDEFIDAVRDAGNVYFPAAFSVPSERPYMIAHSEKYSVRNLDALTDAASGIGHINVIPDIDGKFRKIPSYIECGGSITPYLSLLMGYDYLGVKDDDIQIRAGKYINVGDRARIPLDEYSNIFVNYSGSWGASYGHYSYADVIQSYIAIITLDEPSIDLTVLKDKVCIVGLSASGSVDLHPTPFDPLYPAMGMHAEIFNSIINSSFLNRVSRLINIYIIFLMISGAFIVALRTRPLNAFVMLFLFLVSFILSSILLFNSFGLWIDVFWPACAVILVYILVTLYKYMSEWHYRIIMDNELAIAKKIQQSFLPSSTPSVRGINISSAISTARQVGGDLYDFTVFSEDRFGVMIGDVSGKGVPASLFMAMVAGSFRSLALPAENPDKVLSLLNSKLIRESSSNLFVTMYYGIFDLSSGVFKFSNGGHLPVIHIDKNGSYKFLDVSEGPPLGVVEGSYKMDTLKFSQGDMFVFYTDGIVEAKNARSDMYGRERFLETILKYRDLTADRISFEIERDISRFVRGANQYDDITIIVAKIG